MKKITLLLVSGILSLAATAQNKSAMPTAVPMNPDMASHQLSAAEMAQLAKVSPYLRSHRSHDTKRVAPAVLTFNDWYDLWDQNVATGGGGGSIAYYLALYPDSNLVDDYGTMVSNIAFHGAGMSFDPTDSGYSYDALISTVGHPLPQTGQPYTIDSYYVPIKYLRNNPLSTVVDSVIIEIVVTGMSGPDSGSYDLQYTTPVSAFYPITYDETPRFGDVHYNNGLTAPYNVAPYINDCYFDSIGTRKYRYAIPLTNAVPDTDANGMIYLGGVGNYALHLSPAIPITSMNTHAVSFVSFKSGVAYPLGRHTSISNVIHVFAGEPLGPSTWFRQSTSDATLSPVYPGSYQTGLYATNQTRYNSAGYTYDYHNVLIPGLDYSSPGLSVSFDQWHINWSCTTPTVGAVLGASTVCVSSSITLSDATLSGTWNTTTGNATVSGSGVVTGVTAGTDVISYTVTNSCGSVTATKTVTINPLPVAGTITGPSIVCVGAAIALTDASPGGVWSSGSTSIATVAAGVVTGVGTGTTPIKYTVTNSCGSVNTTKLVTVSLAPVAGTITGASGVCVGSTAILSDAATGGTWSAATGNATVSAGVVTGVTAGTDVISYTATTGCGTAVATLPISINPLPVPVLVLTGTTLSTVASYSGYQWNIAGGPIAGATNSTYTVLLLGSYSVTVEDANGCFGTSIVSIVDPTLGLQNVNTTDNNIRIYPNPSQSVVNIESSVKVNIQLTTMDGRLIMDKQDVTSIDISNLPNGNYMLSVYDANTRLKLKTDRVVKLGN